MKFDIGTLRLRIHSYVGIFFVGAFVLLIIAILMRVRQTEDPLVNVLQKTIPAEAR